MLSVDPSSQLTFIVSSPKFSRTEYTVPFVPGVSRVYGSEVDTNSTLSFFSNIEFSFLYVENTPHPDMGGIPCYP